MRNYEFKLTPAYCLYNGIAIKRQQGSRICFLSENPNDKQLRSRVTKAFKNYLEYVNRQEDCPEIYKQNPSIQFVAGNRSELRMQVSLLYSQNENVRKLEETNDDGQSEKPEDMNQKDSESAAVLLFDTIMTEARLRKATDIHIEKNCVRFRIFGKLITVSRLTEDKCKELIQRIKFLAGMNVLEKKRSQDGHFVYGATEPIFVRVSTVGLVCGKNNEIEESVVIRLLDTARLPLTLEKLGFNEVQLAKIQTMSSVPNGLIIICGPTGAGKSTTAAAMLLKLSENCGNSTKIISLEDPPEYVMPGITQIQIDENNSFSDVLMHVFRQDPDVLMIGEIRDANSATVAVRAALTGHLVIATLHTSTAAGVILRLENLGIPRKLIVSVLKGVIAQEFNNFEGYVNLLADVCEPTKQLLKNSDKELSEQELEDYFDHTTNYNQMLAKTIEILKEKHSVKEEPAAKMHAKAPSKNQQTKKRRLYDKQFFKQKKQAEVYQNTMGAC